MLEAFTVFPGGGNIARAHPIRAAMNGGGEVKVWLEWQAALLGEQKDDTEAEAFAPSVPTKGRSLVKKIRIHSIRIHSTSEGSEDKNKKKQKVRVTAKAAATESPQKRARTSKTEPAKAIQLEKAERKAARKKCESYDVSPCCGTKKWHTEKTEKEAKAPLKATHVKSARKKSIVDVKPIDEEYTVVVRRYVLYSLRGVMRETGPGT